MQAKLYTILFFLFLGWFAFPLPNASAADYDVGWTDLTGVSVSGNDLSKTAGTAWGNGGSASILAHTGSFAVEFSTSETNKAKVGGLSANNPDADYTSIDFAIHLKSDGNYLIRENGTQKASPGAYSTSDVFKVKRSGTTVTYLKNNSVVYTSTVTSTGTLLADTALYNNGATLNNVRFIGAPAYPPSPITDLASEIGDEEIVLTWSAAVTNGSALTEYEVEYGTVTSGTFASSYNDDTTPGATITGLSNGTSYRFRVIAKNSIGDSAPSNVVQSTPNVLADIDWDNLSGVSESGNDITKTAGTDWGNGGATSFDAYAGDMILEFTATETNKGRVCGFSTDNLSTHYNDIEFGIHVQTDATYRILQNGSAVFDDNSTYSSGDEFQIVRNGTTITYYHEGTQIYVSSVSSTGGLMVDAALYNTSSTITDAKVAGNISSQLAGVSHNNNSFDPASSETSTISFTLDQAAAVTITLYTATFNSSGVYTKTFYDAVLSADARSSGANTFVWDGKNSSDVIVPSGVYVYAIEAVSPGETASYDPVFSPGVVTVDNATFTPENFDPYKGEIATVSYDLLVPAWVTVMVGLPANQNETVKLITLQPRDTDDLVEVWDGRDSDGDLAASGEYRATIWTRLIPDNAIIVQNNRDVSVEEVTADPYAIYPVYGQATQITYTISEDADVTLQIVSPSGTVVRTLVNDEAQTADTYTIEWDGKNSSGKIIDTEGHYKIKVSITQGSTTKVREGNITVFK